MTDGVERVSTETLAALVADLLDPRRAGAVVAITPRHGAALVDPARVAAAVGDAGRVVLLDGPAANALSDELPDKLGVFGGACRIWWAGLTPESDPYEHPLIWVRPGLGDVAEARIGELIEERRLAERALREGDEVQGSVVAIDPNGATIDVGGTTTYAHRNFLTREKIAHPHDVLRVGQRVRASVGRIIPGRDPQLDLRAFQGDPWMALAEQVRPGDVVRGRIARRLGGGEALVELLPGVLARVPRHLDAEDRRPAPGATVAIRVVSVDERRRRAVVSLRDAPAETDGAVPVRLMAGGAVFLAPDTDAAVEGASELDRLRARVERLEAELEAARDQIGQLEEDRARLRGELRTARERARAGRGADAGRVRLADTPGDFLEAVRAAYERLYAAAADRERYPLGEIRLGTGFLASVRGLAGIDPQRIVDVCAHVAANRAHEIPSLEVHQRRTGKGGAPQLERADGARAWRVSLQTRTPSARRLHYWVLPGGGGRVVELESVGVHDEGLE